MGTKHLTCIPLPSISTQLEESLSISVRSSAVSFLVHEYDTQKYRRLENNACNLPLDTIRKQNECLHVPLCIFIAAHHPDTCWTARHSGWTQTDANCWVSRVRCYYWWGHSVGGHANYSTVGIWTHMSQRQKGSGLIFINIPWNILGTIKQAVT